MAVGRGGGRVGRRGRSDAGEPGPEKASGLRCPAGRGVWVLCDGGAARTGVLGERSKSWVPSTRQGLHAGPAERPGSGWRDP